MSDSEEEKRKNKKAKRMCVYKKEWEQQYPWLQTDNDNVYKSQCVLCKRFFSISHGGLNDVRKHSSSAEHKKNEQIKKKNQTLNQFLKGDSLNSDEEKKIAAEIVKVYHTVKHGVSFRCTECDVKVCAKIFHDSKIATSMSLGRTKASSIAHNLLGPASIEGPLAVLRGGTYFSISSDATNHGHIKVFPILARFYTVDCGIKNCLLDFYDDADETASAIFTNIKDRLQNLGLDFKNVSAYAADNANVNYGKNHSVFQLLLKENPKVLPARCPAHLLHNAVKNACEKCEFDIEHLVLKVYGHLSYHAKRVQQLKDLFLEADLTYLEILRHVSTRWLSLLPAVERILRGFPILKTYFFEMNENCPVGLKKYFSEADSLKSECFLAFFQNALKIFNDAILILEKDDILVSEVFDIINNLRKKLKERITDNFFGFVSTNILRKMSIEEQQSIKNCFITWYQNALKYLEDRFDFTENNKLATLRLFNLEKQFSFDDLTACLDKMSMSTAESGIDMDQLYEEFCQVKEVLYILIKEKEKAETTITAFDQWHALFTKNKNLVNLMKMFQYIASIPASNAHAERIFSLCGKTWTDDRNRLTPEHVKSELQIRVNFSETCSEFFDYVIKNKYLLKCAKSQNKYSFKNKKVQIL